MNVNAKTLKGLYSNSNAAKFAFDYFAARQNASKRTSVDRLQATLRGEGHDISRGEIIEFFRTLELANCGAFVVGRKGHPSRFEWKVSLVEVGQAATGEDIDVQQLNESDPQLENEVDTVGAEFIEHPYALRRNLSVQLRLPSDLSTVEAGRLADFIRTLPFAGSEQ